VWIVPRFLGGVSSADIFILGSSIVREKVQGSEYSHLGIFIYSGVGAGIALAWLISSVLFDHFDVQVTWIVLCFSTWWAPG
jgi:hypothetical protein